MHHHQHHHHFFAGSEGRGRHMERFGFAGRGGSGDEFGRGEFGGRGGHGRGHGDDGDGGGSGRRGRRERMFESGDLKALILHLLTEQEPRHGYEIIKAIGALTGEEYSPSPGAVYPTLTFLEEGGFISVVAESEDNRKRYVLTTEGRALLAEQTEQLQRTLKRLRALQSRARAQRPAELIRAVENLRTSLRLRMGEGNADREALEKIAAILDRAAVEIGRV